jgi:hypothetical protein
MIIDRSLFVIYSIDSKNSMARFIDLAYTTKGMLEFDELSILKDEYSHLYLDNRIGPFDTEEDLLKFSYLLSETARMDGVCLCGSDAINASLGEAKKVNEFNNVLFEKGEKIENPEEKKRGLFSGLLR